MMVVVKDKPQSSKTLGNKSSSEGQKCGKRTGDELVQSTGHRGFGVIFKLWSAADEAVC